MFAKHWTPGEVKTRLGRDVGVVAAARLHRAFLATSLRRLRTLGERRVLAYSPGDRGRDFADLAGDDWTCLPQFDGDLGQRMERYFDRAFARGARRVVLVGADSPNLPLEYIRRSFQLLEDRAVVLGPADDGGYYLIGAAGSVPPIFSDIAWSTPQVLPRTVERLAEAGISCTTLPPWYDVDQLSDLRRLRADVAPPAENDPDLAWLRAQIDEIAGPLGASPPVAVRPPGR
jgi:rSAM/selenodomain-associated transferase 1